MQECPEIQAQFTAYTDGELAAGECQRLDGHLAECPVCAREWRLFRQTLAQLAALPMVPAPPDLLPAIHAKLARPGVLAGIRNFFRDLDFSMSIPAAAATLVVAVAVGVFFRMTPHQQPSSPDEMTMPPATVSRRAPIALAETRLATTTPRLIPPSQQARSAHPPTMPEAAMAHPDIFITLRHNSAEDIATLVKQLTNRHLATQVADHHMLMIRLAPADLPLLRQTLAGYHATVFPPEAIIPHFPHQKERLVVAIKLR